MGIKAPVIVCKHCKKPIRGKMKFVGLTIICPYCGRPSEEVKRSIGQK